MVINHNNSEVIFGAESVKFGVVCEYMKRKIFFT